MRNLSASNASAISRLIWSYTLCNYKVVINRVCTLIVYVSIVIIYGQVTETHSCSLTLDHMLSLSVSS